MSDSTYTFCCVDSSEDEDGDHALDFKRRRKSSGSQSPHKKEVNETLTEIIQKARENNPVPKKVDRPFVPRDKRSDWRLWPGGIANGNASVMQKPDPDLIKRQGRPVLETPKTSEYLFDSPVKVKVNGNLVNDPFEFIQRKNRRNYIDLDAVHEEDLSPEEVQVINLGLRYSKL